MKPFLITCAVITTSSIALAAASLHAADQALDYARNSAALYQQQVPCEYDALRSEELRNEQIMIRDNNAKLTGWEFQ